MAILFMIAVICLVLGILFLMGKEPLKKKVDTLLNKVILNLGSVPDKKRDRFLGIFLIIFSIFLFVIGISLKR